MTETLKVKRQPRRTSINGTRNRLSVKGKDPNFVYRIVNDTDDRISQFQEMGYEIVKDSSVQVGDKRVAVPSAEGSPVKMSVGGGTQAFVLRIRKDWYEEDQDQKASQIKELETTMKREARETFDYGKFKIDQD